MPSVEQRLDKVEQALAERTLAQLRTEMAVQSMAKDSEAFKGEMRGFKDEMLEFKNEVSAGGAPGLHRGTGALRPCYG